MAYGLNTGGGTPEQQQQATGGLGAEQQQRRLINRQQQSPYAPRNRMNLGTQAPVQRQPTGNLGSAPSPVTADGKINEQNTTQPQQTALNQSLATSGSRGSTSTATLPPGGTTSTGYVPWAPPPVAAPPAPGTPGAPTAASAVPPPTTPDPFQGRGVWNGSGWLPNDHPDAYKFLGPGGTNAGTMTPPDRDHTSDIAHMMQENPGQFPDAASAQSWGEMYYGWGKGGAGTGTGTGTGGQPASAWTYGQAFGEGDMMKPPVEAYYKPGTLPGYQGGAWEAAVLPNDPNAVYGGSTYDQWQSPDQAGQDAYTLAKINETMGKDVVDVNLMNAKSADMQGQALQEALQGQKNNAAARGMLGGGFATAQESGTREQSASNLLDQQRQNRIEAATKNRDYLNTAIDKSGQFLTDQMGRYDISYGNTLKGQITQASDKQAAIDSQNLAKQQALDLAMKQAGLDKTSWDTGMQVHQQKMADALAQEGLYQEGAKSTAGNWKDSFANFLQNKGLNIDEMLGKERNAVTRDVGMGGIDADRYRTDRTFQADMARILAGIEATDKQTGVDYTRIFAPMVGGG